ncbi:MAG: ankyrin repeat domain-containing protein [Candidatus Wallbacteria bacterium]
MFLKKVIIILFLVIFSICYVIVTSEKLLAQANEEINKKIFSAIDSNNPEQLSNLIKRGADINNTQKRLLRNFTKHSPLNYAIIYSGNLEIIKILVDNGAKLDVRDEYNKDALYYEIIKYGGIISYNGTGNLQIVKYLIEKGLDFKKMYDNNETALIIAIKNYNFEIAKYLIEKGIDTKIINNDGKTALMIAKEMNKDKALIELLSH